MKKYAVPALLMVAGHEVISLVALVVAACMFIGDIFNAAEKEGRTF